MMGGGFPGEFVSTLCMQDAALSKNKKSLALATILFSLAFPEVACRMRRFFGLRGDAARQDALWAADSDTVSEEEDVATRITFR